MVTSSHHAPLIVTALLPADVQAWADRLRKMHFPPHRNFLSAHVTLFHALPPGVLDEARDLLRNLAAHTIAPRAFLESVMDLGGGTAFRIRSEGMMDLRARIADHFHGMLVAQDSGRPRLHVTIQNKVARPEAQQLQGVLQHDFVPREFAFAGLALYHYRGGPWEDAGRWAFRGHRKP